MTTTLFVKANNRQGSVSVKLYDAFFNSYKASHPNDTVLELDLYKQQLPYFERFWYNKLHNDSH